MESVKIGSYTVYPNGLIKSEPRPGTHGGFLSPAIDGDGFERVSLSINGRVEHRKVHRVVAEAFIPNPEGLPDVIHENGNLRDNRVSNLFWGKRMPLSSAVGGGYQYSWIL